MEYKQKKKQILNEIKINDELKKISRGDKEFQKFIKEDTKPLIRYKKVLNTNLKNIKLNRDNENKINEVEHFIPKRERDTNEIINFESKKSFNKSILSKKLRCNIKNPNVILKEQKYIDFIKTDILDMIKTKSGLSVHIYIKCRYYKIDVFGKKDRMVRIIDERKSDLFSTNIKEFVYSDKKFNVLNDDNDNINTQIKNVFNRIVITDIDLENRLSAKKYNADTNPDKKNNFNILTTSGVTYEFGSITSIEWLIYEYKPLLGRSYIELPEEINNKKACNNIKNDDNKCFIWSVLCHLFPIARNANRVSNYLKYENTINIKDIDILNGFKIKDIPKFEKNNNLAINVFAYEMKNNNKIMFSFNYENFIKLLLIKQDSIFKNITCVEHINIDVLNKIIDTNILIENEEWNEKIQLENIKNKIKNNNLKVTYINSKYGYGRVYPLKSISLCSVRRELRHTLNFYNNNIKYVDVDVINCHPVILNEICKVNNINLNYLNEYIINRDEIMNNISQKFNLTKELIKQLFIIILYNGCINNFLLKNNVIIKENMDEYIFLKNFQNDIKKIGHILMENNKNQILEIKSFQTKKQYDNDMGLILSVYIQDRERQILEIIYNYCKNNNIIINNDCVLCFDGIMLNENNIKNKNELIKNLEDEILIFTKMNIKLKIKEMNEYINIGDIEYNTIENNQPVIKKEKKDINKISFYPLYISDNENNTNYNDNKIIDLLYVENDEGNNHYVYIKNLSALLNKGGEKKGFYCRRCLNRFDNENNLIQHKKNCIDFDYQTCVMPNNQTVKFSNLKNLNIDHFNIVFDFEAICEKKDEQKGDNTKIYQEHKPISYSMVVNCITDLTKNKYYLYCGDDCMDKFFNDLLDAKKYIEEQYKKIAAIKLTPENSLYIKNCKKCELCDVEFNDKIKKQRDHDHFTGEFRYVLCYKCNLQIQKNKNINIFSHNGKKYDNHFIFLHINKLFTQHKNFDISVIGNTIETYMSFTIKDKLDNGLSFKFLDSNNMLMASLASLSSSLKDEKKKTLYFYLKQKYNFSNEQIKRISDKGYFCYDYLDNINKLEDKELPKYSKWYSRLKQSNILQSEYKHAVSIYKEFGFKNLKEYLLLYNEIDTLLLTDILNNFRCEIFKDFKIESANYISCPSLSWDLHLKSSKNEISLLSDINMYIDFEKGIRGGISSVLGDRYVIANNKYMKNYDSTKESNFLFYGDVNALYTYIMNTEKLPYSNFEYVEDLSIFNVEYIKNFDFEGEIGFYLVVDLEYPKELYEDHINYPLAPNKMKIAYELLSEYQKNLIDNNGCEVNQQVEKLILSFLPKNEYYVDGKTLQFYLNHGLILKKIHKVISYKQKFLLKDYSQHWTDVRTEAKKNKDKTNDSISKLFTNSIFGKTMQNTRKYKNIQVLTSEQKNKFLKYSTKNLIKNICLFNEDAIAIEKKKTKTKLNQPIFMGQAILDRSKIHMYKTYYDILKPKYGKNVELLYTDTDSMILNIKTADLYDDMKDMDIFDFSEMKNKKFYDEKTETNIQPENHYKLGAFKCESKGLPITKFIALRSKMYVFEIEEEKKIESYKKSKGMSKNVVSNYIFNDYLESLTKNNIKKDYMTSLRSIEHKIEALNMNKISLTPYDDKRFYIDNIRSVPYGYK